MEDPAEVSSENRLWAAIGYPIPIVALIVLFMEDKKAIPFLKFHAVQSLGFNIVLWAFIMLLVTVTLGIGSLCAPFAWLITFWPAYDSYKGNLTEIPVLTNFIRNQGWV